LEQIKKMKLKHDRCLIIVEGTEDIYSIRNIHPNAIRGMLATITVSYGLPILYTKDANDTAQLLYAIAKREQWEGKREFSPHADRKPTSVKDQQEYVVSCLPGIGLNLGIDLLKHFGSVKNVFNASENELKDVEKLGDKKASSVREIIEKKYD